MSTTVKTVEILTTLDSDPHVSFFAWEMDVQDVASSMAKSIHSLGLLSEVLTDAQWAVYPGNAIIDQAGNTQIAARYQLPGYVDIHGGMTSIDLYVAKASNDRVQLWIDSREALKRAILKSLGKVVRQVIQESKVRFQLMTVLDIMAKVRLRYGQMEKDTFSNLEERMHTLLPTADDLDTHISNLQEMFNVSETAGFPVDSYRQVATFRDTVCAHPTIVKVLEKFDFDFPDPKAVSFAQITAFLIRHLPNVKHAQMAATRATANLAAVTAYSTLEVESQRLRAAIEKLKRKRTGGQQDRNQNKNKRQQGKQTGEKQHEKQNGKQNGERQRDKTRSANEPTKELKYCFGHGYQRSHVSSECKMLAGDKEKYTAAMRRATGPANPPGGSNKVNGQVPSKQTKMVSANVATSYDLDEDEISDHDDNSDFDETAIFLASVLNNDSQQNNDDEPTVTVTAMMMADHTLLFGDTDQQQPRASVIQTDEVPRLALDANQGDQIHVGTVTGSASAQSVPSPTKATSPTLPNMSPALSLTPATSQVSNPKTGFFDDEYINGKRSRALTTTAAVPTLARSEDIRRTDHPEHAKFQTLRGKMVKALRQLEYICDFDRRYIPTTAPSPTTFTILTALLTHRERVEIHLYNLHADLASDGTRLDPKRDIEPEYEILSKQANDINRTMFIEYVTFLAPPGQPRESYSPLRRSFREPPQHELPLQTNPTVLNPASRASPTHHEVCTAILTTNAEIERHEERI